MKRIGFIGGGKMAEAIISGIIKAGLYKSDEVYVTDIAIERLNYLKEKYSINTIFGEAKEDSATNELYEKVDIVVLAIKPQFAKSVLLKLKDISKSSDKLIISIMGGVTLSMIESYLDSAVIRVMPNTPMLVNMGASGIALGKKADKTHSDIAYAIFSALGISYIVDEKLIDPLTSVSGTGPAYTYMFIEALSDGGVLMGLPRELAKTLAAQTVMGAAKMVLETGEHPGKLKDNVCSPGGATIAGVRALEAGAFRGTVMNAVEAGKLRMEEVGKKVE